MCIRDRVCPELVQNDFNSENLLQTMEKMINDSLGKSSMQKYAKEIRKILAQNDTYSQVVEVIENYLWWSTASHYNGEWSRRTLLLGYDSNKLIGFQ